MGRVQVDINKGGREWEYVTLSDVESVRGLIKFRTRFDLLFQRSKENPMASGVDLANYDEEVLCTYIDLDNLIDKTKLNTIQCKILELNMNGYSEEDIGEILNIKPVTVDSTINTICKKLVETNYEMWKSNIYWDTKRVKSNYKKCSKCEEMLPATEEYFSPNPDSTDKLYSICRYCKQFIDRNRK